VSTACANWYKINTDHAIGGFVFVPIVDTAVVAIDVVRDVEVAVEADVGSFVVADVVVDGVVVPVDEVLQGSVTS
jgi:hypothetical protein